MQVNGTQLNPAATNLYSAVEIKKPAEAGQTLSSGGVESELEVEDVFRISSEMDQDGAQSPEPDSGDPDLPKQRKKEAKAGEAEPAAEAEPPENPMPRNLMSEDPMPEDDPMSLWG
jgi:hypothetical protein